MFRILTEKEQLRKERAKNAQLLAQNQQLEEAMLELAQIVSEVSNGETVSEQDK